MNFIYKLYFFLPNFSNLGFIGKAINKGLELSLIFILNLIVPFYFIHISKRRYSGLNVEKREKKYIVSLTSFPARINKIWIVVECLLRQSYKADKIILWLADEQFPERCLPESLTNLQSRGLIILFCDDIKSHKKYFYTMLEHPNDIIITVDDDVFYPKNILRDLIDIHKKYPNAIASHFAHKITFDEHDNINPYKKWMHKCKDIKEPSFFLSQVGVGGVLYPPNILCKDAFNKKLLLKLCPRADDIWLKAMSYIDGNAVVTSTRYNKQLAIVSNTQSESLVSTNSKKGENDIAIKNIMDFYGISFKEYRS